MSGFGGHINRRGGKYVGDPITLNKETREACLYAATMVAKHMPAFSAMAHEFEAMLRPPATIMLTRLDDPTGPAITFEIPSLMLPSSPAVEPKQESFE